MLDASRNRALKSTLVICTGILGVGSEFLQGIIPDNGREFDVWDIGANIAGSLSALALSAWYHKRMLERKRKRKGYVHVSGDGEGDADRDVELGEGLNGQESGVVHHETAPQAVSLEQELDNWDENAPDEWDDEEQANAAATADGRAPSTSPAQIADDADDADKTAKKRAD